MCGIFGQITRCKDIGKIQSNTSNLLRASTERGSTSAGVVFVDKSNSYVLKKFESPKLFISSKEYHLFWNHFKNKKLSDVVAILGQCRLATSGSPALESYNQPITFENLLGFINGIVTKVDSKATSSDEWYLHADSQSNDSIDFFSAISNQHKQQSLKSSVLNVLQRIEGSANFCAVSLRQEQIVLGTNIGSLYIANVAGEGLYYASEPKFLQAIGIDSSNINQLEAGTALLVSLKDLSVESFSLQDTNAEDGQEVFISTKKTFHTRLSSKGLKKCKKCILPETYPFIHFDQDGICNYCNHYIKQTVHGEEALLKYLEPFRSKDGRPDCLVGLSGGRDSCYGLYVLKKKYGMNPIAYTFDWGLTTNVSRRNQALVCSKLGVEHIIRAPDIIRKRRFVRKNVEAWFKNPHLGMIPLFQAGDKEFYLYGRKLRRERNIELTVLCSGYQLEQREFMIGFAGVNQPPVRNNHDFYYHPLSTKTKLALNYILQYMKNPAYINESLFESLRSFVISFIQKSNFLYLFHYLPWNEAQIEKELKLELGWESDNKYGINQWRMGDGQTAFNNLLYYRMAGFSEFDVFRSNQIREGLISRDEALKLAAEDNIPKYDSIAYFCQATGLSFDEVISRINLLPKIFEGELEFEEF